MALKEYKRGAAFPGTIGRIVQRLIAGLARTQPRQKGRAQRALLDHRRRGLWADVRLRRAGQHAQHRPAGEQRIALHQHAHDGALLADARLHADRAGTITPTVWRPSPSSPPATPAMTDACRSRTACSRRSCSRRATTPSAPASGISIPPRKGTPAGPYHRWPLGRGFERFYGFLGGETNQWFPDLTYDNHSVPQPKSVEEGYHLTEDLSDKAIQFILDAHVNAPDKPFFLYHATGAAHAPHQVSQEWIDKYKGKFDMGWDKYREIVFANQKKLGIFPANAELSRHDPDVPAWDTLSADQKKLYTRLDGGVRRLPRARGPRIRPHPEDARGHRRARQHADHDHPRQRRVVRGRRRRLLQRDEQLQPALGKARRDPAAHRSARRSHVLQPLSLGLGLGRQYAVPALEERGLSRRLHRQPDRLLARRDQGQRRGARTVRARDRHGADCPRGAGDRTAREDSRRHAVADRGRVVRPHLQRRERADEAHHPVLRDVRQPGDLQQRLESQLRRILDRATPRARRRAASSAG